MIEIEKIWIPSWLIGSILLWIYLPDYVEVNSTLLLILASFGGGIVFIVLVGFVFGAIEGITNIKIVKDE